MLKIACEVDHSHVSNENLMAALAACKTKGEQALFFVLSHIF
jgi:hypothetical protein